MNNNNNRFCTHKGHEDSIISHYCSFLNCQYSRWVCSECLAREKHKHGLLNNSHLKNKKQFQEYMLNYLKEIESNPKFQPAFILHNFKNILNQIQILTKVLEELINQFYQVAQELNSLNIRTELNNLRKTIISKQLNMNEDEIKQLFTINQKFQQRYHNVEYIQHLLNQGPIIYNKINEQYLLMQQKYFKMNENMKNYSIQCLIPFEQNNNPRYIQISPDEQKLAFITNQLLKIFWLDGKKVIEIQIEKIDTKIPIDICQFSQDSQELFVAGKSGKLLIYNNSFAVKQVKDIPLDSIQQIFTFSDQTVLLVNKNKIVLKYDLQNQKQLLRLNADIDNIDYHRQYEIIVTTDSENVSFWNGKNGNNIFTKNCKQDKHSKILFIQFIQKESKLMTVNEEGVLRIWLMTLEKKDIILINWYQDTQNQIKNGFITQNDMIIIIYKQSLEILNKNLKPDFEIQKLPFELGEYRYGQIHAQSTNIIATILESPNQQDCFIQVLNFKL